MKNATYQVFRRIWYPPPHSLLHRDHSVQSSPLLSFKLLTVRMEQLLEPPRHVRSSERTRPGIAFMVSELEAGTEYSNRKRLSIQLSVSL